ncbi:hypothetical protein [Futiania mangrovi]|uniref:Uncharacterized protein n=1 Tax=Futiania mangrovi TaxID=2959716 RepID=A0A9J6PEP0_9PROT|nr:hypothetical protein [Futiania mangrovii]MCP1336243.1 hypothetical protein [Futiania mangrovii]
MSSSIGGAAGAEPLIVPETGGDFALPDTSPATGSEGGTQVALFGGGPGEKVHADPRALGEMTNYEGTGGDDSVSGAWNYVSTGRGDDTANGYVKFADLGPGNDSFDGMVGRELVAGAGDDLVTVRSPGNNAVYDLGSGDDRMITDWNTISQASRIDGGSNGFLGSGVGGEGDTLRVITQPGDPDMQAVRNDDGGMDLMVRDASGSWSRVPQVQNFENIYIQKDPRYIPG